MMLSKGTIVTVMLEIPLPAPAVQDDAAEWIKHNIGKNCGMDCNNPLVHFDPEPTGLTIEWPQPPLTRDSAAQRGSGWRKLMDTCLKPTGLRWTCAGCGQSFGPTDSSFRTTMSGAVEYYCRTCCNENG